MPLMTDRRFARSVIYMCAHSDDGRHGPHHQSARAPHQLPRSARAARHRAARRRGRHLQRHPERQVHVGGPVETGRGFVLHTPTTSLTDSTLPIDQEVSLTAIDRHPQGHRRAARARTAPSWRSAMPAGRRASSKARSRPTAGCIARPISIWCSTPTSSGSTCARLAKIGIDPSHLVSDAGHAYDLRAAASLLARRRAACRASSRSPLRLRRPKTPASAPGSPLSPAADRRSPAPAGFRPVLAPLTPVCGRRCRRSRLRWRRRARSARRRRRGHAGGGAGGCARGVRSAMAASSGSRLGGVERRAAAAPALHRRRIGRQRVRTGCAPLPPVQRRRRGDSGALRRQATVPRTGGPRAAVEGRSERHLRGRIDGGGGAEACCGGGGARPLRRPAAVRSAARGQRWRHRLHSESAAPARREHCGGARGRGAPQLLAAAACRAPGRTGGRTLRFGSCGGGTGGARWRRAVAPAARHPPSVRALASWAWSRNRPRGCMLDLGVRTIPADAARRVGHRLAVVGPCANSQPIERRNHIVVGFDAFRDHLLAELVGERHHGADDGGIGAALRRACISAWSILMVSNGKRLEIASDE